MNHLNDPVKRLVRRFVSLPPNARLRVAGNLLRWRDESEPTARSKSFLEQFWDEVEAAHGDGLYTANPFARGPISYGALNLPQQRLVRLSC
ncbi:MAG TPA: hypothetical protein VN256_00815 [Pyrinomonadaceae bacterium]|nr:hypothetical protein [Pyrinomonadaceae bacterium]